MKDPFSYVARWSSIGLDCSNCEHFRGPDIWPDTQRVSKCTLHDLSLAVQLNDNGHKQGEWFCASFSNLGTANQSAVREFESVRPELRTTVLYGGYGKNNKLVEIEFHETANAI